MKSPDQLALRYQNTEQMWKGIRFSFRQCPKYINVATVGVQNTAEGQTNAWEKPYILRVFQLNFFIV